MTKDNNELKKRINDLMYDFKSNKLLTLEKQNFILSQIEFYQTQLQLISNDQNQVILEEQRNSLNKLISNNKVTAVIARWLTILMLIVSITSIVLSYINNEKYNITQKSIESSTDIIEQSNIERNNYLQKIEKNTNVQDTIKSNRK